ncbi:MAG: hypothetical protein ACSHX8_15575 [Opitutaceae bacterium]
MNLESAIQRIQKSFKRLDKAYGRAVFDEIAIVGLDGAELKLLHYQGPREVDFLAEFVDDSIALRKELTDDQTAIGGEFSFTREGAGAGIDAYICLGTKVYLFCNNTEKSMSQVTADPAWLNAQGEFLNASQFFAVDPLEV